MERYKLSYGIAPWDSRKKFAIIDIKNFYPSTSESLLTKALNFPKGITDVNRENMWTMYHVGKSLLFSNEKPWRKRGGNLFDVTMGP